MSEPTGTSTPSPTTSPAPTSPSGLHVLPVPLDGEIRVGADLAAVLAQAAAAHGTPLRDDDCLVVTQKIVSKAEDRIVTLDPDDAAARRALIESESTRILRRRGELLITETTHGFICANAGIDQSNVAEGTAALLPRDADRSARRIRDALGHAGVRVAVIITDTFGRAWRHGLVDVAIGIAGIAAVLDLRGSPDTTGRELAVTEVAIADEVAASAELVMGKTAGVPAAIVRGLDPAWMRVERSGVNDLVRPGSEDLFR